MSSMHDLITSWERNWASPRRISLSGVELPTAVVCRINRPGTSVAGHGHFPPDVTELWAHASSAILFLDADFGQSGLKIFSGSEADSRTAEFAKERARDFLPGDFVLGEFIGDLELLLVRTDPNERDFGQVLVARPIDGRRYWPPVADRLLKFLDRFTQAEGEKYWERRAGRPSALT